MTAWDHCYPTVEEAVALVEEHATSPGGRVARIAGVPLVPFDEIHDADSLYVKDEQWVTVVAAKENITGATDRFWVPGGLAVHTTVTIVPGVSIDVAYLYLFEPPQGMFDLFNEAYR